MVRKRNIAYLLTPVEFGGAEKVNVNFLNNVNKSKFNISPILLTRPWEGETVFERMIKLDKYDIKYIPVGKRDTKKGRDYLRVIRCFWILYGILKKGRYELLHTHGYFADLIGIPAAKILNIPTIATCHGFIEYDKTLKIYNMLDRYVLRYAEMLLTVSEELKEELIKYKISKTRIKVIKNAVNTAEVNKNTPITREEKRRQLGFSKTDNVLGFVGRISKEKGLKVLIEAFSMSCSTNSSFKLLIVGNGPQKDELEKLVKEKNLQDMVTFTGFQNDIASWMGIMDLFILPSLTEGTPLALLEAMSIGLPVIASRVGGVPKVVENGKTGILVEAGNQKEISDSINLLFDDPSLRARHGQNALNHIRKHFDVHDWCRVIEKQYDMLINAKKPVNTNPQ